MNHCDNNFSKKLVKRRKLPKIKSKFKNRNSDYHNLSLSALKDTLLKYFIISQVMLVEQIEYDEVLTCDHSYDNR